MGYPQVGINLSDPVYRGVYHGKAIHENDLADVISRATRAGCKKLMITGSDLTESAKAVEIAKTYGEKFISYFALSSLNYKRNVKYN